MQANRIDEWLAAENRLDEIPARPDAAAIDPARTSGLALLRSALDGTGLNASIGRTLDFRLVEVEHGRAVFQGAASASDGGAFQGSSSSSASSAWEFPFHSGNGPGLHRGSTDASKRTVDGG